MPLAVVLVVIDVLLVVHAAKTGRFSPWAYVILMIPGLGALAYVLFELVPEAFGSRKGVDARRRVRRALDPERDYRAHADDLTVTDSIANRAALAEQCLALGKFEEALTHYDSIIARPHGEEPAYLLGRARAEFGLDRFQAVVATLDDLRAHWPDWPSADGHLLYARALEAAGRSDEAVEEYAALADYYPGAEARARYGLLLDRLGRGAEAKRVFTDLLAHFRRAPAYVRKAQSEWLGLAAKAVRG